MDFDDYAYIKVHLTKDKDVIKAAIDTIDSSGGTNINRAVNTAIDELTSEYADLDNTKIIILLTDGVGTYNTSTTQRAIDNGIIIYTVGLGYDIDESLLKSIAEQTGGKYYYCINSEDLVDAFERIQDETLGEIDTTDSDLDGVYDVIETTGVINQFGELVISNPYEKDTDGDGVDDGTELGGFIKCPLEPYMAEMYEVPTISYYMIRSYPDRIDSDGDGINDKEDTRPLDKTPYDGIDLFPADYRGYIIRLKDKYPNWRLVPLYMDIDFDFIVQAQMLWGYPCSDIDECIRKPKKLQDGDRWYVATCDSVEYYVDPRNHLSEEYIFQFLSSLLEPGMKEDKSVLEVMIKSMEKEAPTYFLEAVEGEKVSLFEEEPKQVSAYFLAAKSLLETDRGKSELAKGRLPNYEGFYNMYGIGCKDGPDSKIKGAEYAKNKRWTSQELAIKGGASFIIDDYISAHQDSFYFCKWNIKKIIDNKDIILNSWIDIHQYATNVADACSKGQNLFNVIKNSGTLNESLIFRIPVYGNIPSHTKISIQKGSLLKEEVKELQSLLKELGYKIEDKEGTFGDGTKIAVMDFQRECDIEVTGITDERTWFFLLMFANNSWAN